MLVRPLVVLGYTSQIPSAQLIAREPSVTLSPPQERFGMVSVLLSVLGVLVCGGLGGLAGWAAMSAIGWTGTAGAVVAAIIGMVVATVAWVAGAALMRKVGLLR